MLTFHKTVLLELFICIFDLNVFIITRAIFFSFLNCSLSSHILKIHQAFPQYFYISSTGLEVLHIISTVLMAPCKQVYLKL